MADQVAPSRATIQEPSPDGVSSMQTMFAKPSRIDLAWYEAATDDFLRTWRSPRARMAFFAAARHIYMDEPYGESGFFTRLAALTTPAYYIYGRQDPLITPLFARKVQGIIPDAQVELWDDCGHAPQLEHPEKVAESLMGFMAGYGSSEAEAV